MLEMEALKNDSIINLILYQISRMVFPLWENTHVQPTNISTGNEMSFAFP